MKFFIICVVLLLSQLCLGSQNVWRIQSHKNSDSILDVNFIKYFIEPVNKELKGKLKIELYSQDSEEVLFGNKESFSAVKHGIIDGRLSSPMYWGSIDPVFAILGDLVGAWESTDEYLSWYSEENGFELFQKAYSKHNTHFVGFTLTPHESLVSRAPIRNIKDLKNHVMRTPPGSMADDFFKELGANTRPIGMPQVKNSFELNKIILADYSTIGENLNEGLYDIAFHTNYPGFHSLPVIEFVVNKDSWNQLTNNQKQIVLKHSIIWRTQNIKKMKELDKIALKKMKDKNIKIYKWSSNEIKRSRKVASRVWTKYAKKNKLSKEVIQSISQWLQKNDKL